MARVRVDLRRAGMKELLLSREVRQELTGRMQRVLSAARASAPVDTGEHRDSLRLEQATTDRAVVRVVADSPQSFWAEVRTGHMARALDQAGGAG